MKKLILLAAVLLLMGQGCVQIVSPGGGGADGGVYKSIDFGDTWQQKVFISQDKNQTSTIASTNVQTVVFDPQDSQTIYIGTRENGMYVTKDGGEHWQQILTNKGEVRAIAVDSKNHQIVYAAIGEKIVKSTDGGNVFKLIYSEPTGQQITEIQVDSFDPNKVYAGVFSGQLIKSTDGGQSWLLLKNFDSKIQRILINPKDTRIVYVGTLTSGIFKTTDGGANWTDFGDTLRQFDGSFGFQDLVMSAGQPSVLIYASDYGLLRTDDNGKTWNPIKLLTDPNTITVYSVAVNPKNSGIIIYGTRQNIFKTKDGGKTWVSKPLPTQRAPNRMIADPRNPDTVYMAALKT